MALVAAALAVITATAALLRFHDLPAQPGFLYPDEAAEGFDATRISAGFHPVFFADDGGREGLFAYLVALAFRVGGVSVATLREVSALLGVLAVLATVLAIRRFSWIAALAAGGWSAGSVWLVSVSRDGFRNILVPLVGALALWALIRWADRPSRASALIAGGLCGLGLWTYQPLKLLPVLVAAWLLVLRRSRAPVWPSLRRTLAPAVVAWVVVSLPLLVVAVASPRDYFGRGLQVSGFNPEFGGATSLPAHVLRTLGAFGLVGDPNPRHDAGNLPLLTVPLLGLALLGAVRAWRSRPDPGALLLLLGVPVFLLPALAALEGASPHFLRLLGMAPSIAGLIGLGCLEIIAAGGRRIGAAGRVVAASVAVAAIAVASIQGADAYFSRTPSDLYTAYSGDLVALAELARAPHTTVIIDNYSAVVVEFLDHDHPPAIVAPNTRLGALDGPLLATRRSEIAAAAGDGAAARAVPAAFDPQGQAAVWRLDP